MRVGFFPRLILIVAIAIASPLAWSLTAIKRDFNELVALSDVVLIGTVDRMQSEWRDPVAQDFIYTFITFRDIEVIKGEFSGDNYTTRVAGGSLPPYSMTISGAPQFTLNERYILFVKDNNHVMFPFVGVDQGIFHVDSSTGEPLVKTLQGNVVTQIVDENVVTTSTPAKALLRGEGLSVDEFKRQIRVRLKDAADVLP